MPMMRFSFFSTVIGSCYPYHKLVEGFNAGKGIKIREENAFNYQIDFRNLRDLKELILAPTTNL